METYNSCENCGNDEPGTDLYLCPKGHKFCYICSIITTYDMLRITCPICKKDHSEVYRTIADDEIDDDFIDDDIHDYVDRI